MKYILNSAVITSPGAYEYDLCDDAEAIRWLDDGGWVSLIGYEETARALGALTGREIPVDRRTVRMQPGDEALIFRLVLSPGQRRIRPDDKGRLPLDFITRHSEMGILRCRRCW